MIRRRHTALAVAALATLALTACSSDASDDGDDCAGSTSGDFSVHESGGILTDDVVAPVDSVDLDAQPPLLSLRLDGALPAERDNAVDLEVGDRFTVKGVTYEVAGFCEDQAWLNESSG